MWGIFWRLYAAHLFSLFPLLTNIASRSADAKRLIWSHTIIVAITTTLVVVYSAVYRPLLFVLVPLVAVYHYILDLVVLRIRPNSPRGVLLAALGWEFVLAGLLILTSAAFAWGYVYPGADAFFRLSLAVFALWGAPHFIHLVKSTIAGKMPQLPFVERFKNFAFVERTLLYIGISASSIYIVAAGILIAVLIRLLIYLNEENVPIPLWEWAVVVLLAGVPRAFMGGIKIFGL